MRRQGRSSAFCSSMDVHSGLHTNSNGPAKMPPKSCLHRILFGQRFCTVAAGKWLADTNSTMTCIQCYSISLVRLLKCWQRMMTVTTVRGGGRGRRRSSYASVEKHKMISFVMYLFGAKVIVLRQLFFLSRHVEVGVWHQSWICVTLCNICIHTLVLLTELQKHTVIIETCSAFWYYKVPQLPQFMTDGFPFPQVDETLEISNSSLQ